MGMCCPRIGLCQPAISRRSPFPIPARPPGGTPRKKFAPENNISCRADRPVSQSGPMDLPLERLPIVEDGREVSHLAVRFDSGSAGGPDRPCFLYLHGFGSEQAGEKAEQFRAR